MRTRLLQGLSVGICALGLISHAGAQPTPQPVVGYVANSQDNTVSLLAIDPNNNVVTALSGPAPKAIGVGTSPMRVAVGSGLVFVTNQGSNSITAIDSATNTALGTTIQIQPVGSGPAPHPQGVAALVSTQTLLYVANSGDNSVSVIDVTNIASGSYQEIARLTSGIGPAPIEVVFQGTKAYVLNNNAGGLGTVSVIDSTTSPPSVVQSISVGTNPVGIAASPDGAFIYVTNRGDNTVSAINVQPGNGAITTISNITDPVGVAFDPNPPSAGTRLAYVADYSTGTVTELLNEAVCATTACFSTNPFALPAGSHPSQVGVVDGGGGSEVFLTDPSTAQVINFLPSTTPSPILLQAGNGTAGLGFVIGPNPAPPVCGFLQNSLSGSSATALGICVGANAGTPGLAFQVSNTGFSCASSTPNPPSVCSGSGGSVGGFQGYDSSVPAGVYTVIICSDGSQPPNCGAGATSAQQTVVWPGAGGTAPTVTCPSFTVTPDATKGVTADATAVCNDGMFSLPNKTNPPVSLSLFMRLNWGDGTLPDVATGTQASGNTIQKTHQYASAGPYTVTLSAVDTTLLAATPQSTSVTVVNKPPTCTLPAASVNGFLVTVAPQCFDQFNRPVVQIVVAWGAPGSTPTTLTGSAVNQPVSFTYPTTTSQNPFTITVTSVDSLEQSSSPVTTQVTVPGFVPQGPSCTVSATASVFQAQAPVTCNATAAGDVVSNVTVTWGDGTSDSASPNSATYTHTFPHTYPRASTTQTYTISVVATDLAGLQSTPATTQISISPPVAPICTLTATSTGGFAATATAQCTDLDATLVSVSVDFGDGTIVQGTAGSPNFGPQTFPHTYAVAGTYTITLNAADSQDLATQVSAQVTVPSLILSDSGSASLAAGQVITVTVTVPSDVGSGPLTLSCIPSPPATGITCLFFPDKVTPGQSSTLTIATNASRAAVPELALGRGLVAAIWLLLPGLLVFGPRASRVGKRSRVLSALAALVVVALLLSLGGCGNSPPKVTNSSVAAPGVYTFLIGATNSVPSTVATVPYTVTITGP